MNKSKTVGVDVGKYYTKAYCDQTNFIFKSNVLQGVDTFKKNNINLEIGDINYLVGSNQGIYTAEQDKSKDLVFKICLLTALAKFSKDVDSFNVVTGLPPGHYSFYKNQIANTFSNTEYMVNLNGESKIIHIDKVFVYPESVGFVSIEKIYGDAIVIDIGGETVDVSYFIDERLEYTKTYELGTRKLYGYIANYINTQNGTDYEFDEIERVIKRQTIVVDNKPVKYDTTNLLVQHLSKIVSEIKNDFPWKKSVKYFIGGGSVLFKEILKAGGFNVSDSNIFANAVSFYKLGEVVFGNDC